MVWLSLFNFELLISGHSGHLVDAQTFTDEISCWLWELGSQWWQFPHPHCPTSVPFRGAFSLFHIQSYFCFQNLTTVLQTKRESKCVDLSAPSRKVISFSSLASFFRRLSKLAPGTSSILPPRSLSCLASGSAAVELALPGQSQLLSLF